MTTRRAFTAGIATALVSVPLRAKAQSAPGLVQGLEGNGISPELRAAPVAVRLRAGGKDADVWTLGGRLGPVLRIKHGQELRLALKNDTALPLSLHLHGVRGPNPMDGVGNLTQEPVTPGGRFDYRLTPPDAGTFLIRPCLPGGSAEPLERGLSGLLVVEEQNRAIRSIATRRF